MFNENDLHHLSEVFSKYPSVQAVYLFGSAAEGTMHNESDIDLAVVSNDKSLCSKKLSILTDLARNGFCEVDLVFIDDTDAVLQYEAVRNNVLVYQTPAFDRGSLYSNVIRKYLDFYPFLSVQRQAYKRRILGGAS